MSEALILRHCAVMKATEEQIRVSLELLSSQRAGLEAYVRGLTPVRQSLPEHCAGHREEDCGLRSEDAWIDRSSFTEPNRKSCRACGYVAGS
jgi:hypothetical protein